MVDVQQASHAHEKKEQRVYAFFLPLESPRTMLLMDASLCCCETGVVSCICATALEVSLELNREESLEGQKGSIEESLERQNEGM